MGTQKDCIFCQMARGEAPALTVYEDETVLSILDIKPCTDGHCLIIPRKHIAHFYEMSDEELTELFKAARLVARKIKKAFNSDYVCLFARGGRIGHAHIAVFPSTEHDELSGFPQSVINKARMDLNEVAAKLRQA